VKCLRREKTKKFGKIIKSKIINFIFSNDFAQNYFANRLESASPNWRRSKFGMEGED
jgi:hypothetical protein